MPPEGLTGARIRRRRLDRGMKQADLARACGISPSYLNLIEHDRRRIGGKLLADIAEALDVTPERLRIGADAQEIAALRAAAADTPEVSAELDTAEDFAARFPGWAGLVAEQARRIAVLQRTVELMGDRMTHDPQLAASLHNILSTVTAIRATSAILAGDDPVEPGWRQRFHRNLYEDSRRLAEATEALVVDLDADAAAETGTTPLDQMEEWLEAAADLDVLEPGRAGEAVLLEAAEAALPSEPARALARREIARLAADARAMPGAALRAAIGGSPSPDPMALADRFGVPLAAVFRRLAARRETGAGLVICDGSGTLTRRRQIPGFPVPRFGAACPVWPLYAALGQIGRPVSAILAQAGGAAGTFHGWAIAETRHPGGYGAVPVTEATMLVLPAAGGSAGDLPVLTIGASCRVCPAEGCAARRELSILGAGA